MSDVPPPPPGGPSYPPPPSGPAYPPPPPGGYGGVPPDVNQKKVLAGVLGILLGGLGVHRFILGDTMGGILRIVITLVTCGLGSIIGLIEGIMYLVKTDEEFYRIYILEKKAWF